MKQIGYWLDDDSGEELDLDDIESLIE